MDGEIEETTVRLDCVHCREEDNTVCCETFSELICEAKDCGQYLTREKAERQLLAKRARAAARNICNKKTKLDCVHWQGVGCKCNALEAPFCAVGDCSLYEQRASAIYWVKLQRTNHGWEEAEPSNEPRGVR